jgi:hypothetical protein
VRKGSKVLKDKRVLRVFSHRPWDTLRDVQRERFWVSGLSALEKGVEENFEMRRNFLHCWAASLRHVEWPVADL